MGYRYRRKTRFHKDCGFENAFLRAELHGGDCFDTCELPVLEAACQGSFIISNCNMKANKLLVKGFARRLKQRNFTAVRNKEERKEEKKEATRREKKREDVDLPPGYPWRDSNPQSPD